MRPLNAAEVEDKNCTEIVHVLDENVSGYIIKFTFNIFMDTVRRLGGLPFAIERLRFTFTAYGKRQTSVENFSE